MSRTTMRARGQLTLPDDIRAAARLEIGDLLEASITPDGILLRPQKIVDATQAWFWSPAWQAGEQVADGDLRERRLSDALDGDAFVQALGKRAKRPPKR